jgi:hypothetical protein
MNDLKECAQWYKEGMNIFWTASEGECMMFGLKSVADGIGAL